MQRLGHNLVLRLRKRIQETPFNRAAGNWVILLGCTYFGRFIDCRHPNFRNAPTNWKFIYLSNWLLGKNCEECAPFYQDLPWRRGTPSNPFECKQCECNSHATSCYFDPSLYLESNRTSGGVCIDCMDNTEGRDCGTCRDTFYVDGSKSVSDADVCLECACDMMGVIANGVCNKTTGQCACKDNVQGRTCDQCKEG